jgi:hypothetical protein
MKQAANVRASLLVVGAPNGQRIFVLNGCEVPGPHRATAFLKRGHIAQQPTRRQRKNMAGVYDHRSSFTIGSLLGIPLGDARGRT